MHIFEAKSKTINQVHTVMEESERKIHVENGDKEILFSKAIKAGKRIYYLDVKKNLKNDLFLAITESKKIQAKNGNGPISFEKHKIFLYKEDFNKFMEGMEEVIGYIKKWQESLPEAQNAENNHTIPEPAEETSSPIKLEIKELF